MSNESKKIPQSTIAPWLSVRDTERATTFYKDAFGAIETYRLDNSDGGPVVRLSVNGAEFWLSNEAEEKDDKNILPLGGDSIRLILIVDNPDAFFKQALKGGATEVFPVSEDHGWRLGRLADPFGLHWEIGYEL
ncbi:MAG: VOC family protein [Ginsengibacter sp.]